MVGGNVETASRIVDVVFAAFAAFTTVPAQGQGTVNNLAFGNDRFTYYETIGGGQGACAHADGPAGVHVAISNTLNTPVESLELAYPLRVERYALRLGSGGAGAHRGGDGVVRSIRVLADCRCSLLTERRGHAPQGAAGGEPGLPGRNLRNGEELPAKATVALGAGELITIETPGRRRLRTGRLTVRGRLAGTGAPGRPTGGSATIAMVAAAASSDNSRLLAATTPRALGAYYTPPAAASVLAEWVVESGAATVLEPSMGDGVFLAAVARAAVARGRRVESWGVELAADTFAAAVAAGRARAGTGDPR